MSGDTNNLLKKIPRRTWRVPPVLRKMKLAFGFIGVMALLISIPLLMIAISPRVQGGSVYFTNSTLDERFAGTSMTGTAGNPYVFEGLALSASDPDEELGWKWVFASTTRYVVIRDCTFVGSNQAGNAITLTSASYVRVEGCRIQGFGTGIFADQATSIAMEGNCLLFNRVGINISASLFVSCSENELVQNLVGIMSDAASGQCSFTQNNFTRNTLAAVDASTANSWSVGGAGNYYDDYISTYPSAGVACELSSDALMSVMIASEPYEISTSAPQGAGAPAPACGGGHHDCFPLVVCPKGMPSLGVALPTNDSLHASVSPDFQVALNGWAITAVYYTINDLPEKYSIVTGQLLHVSIALSGTINLTAWAGLSSGIHNITFHVLNWWGQEMNQTIHVEKDMTAPALLVSEPIAHAVFANSPVYTLSASDPYLDAVTYTVGGSSTAFAVESTGTIDSSAWEAQPEGDVSLKFRANDTLGNVNETVVVVCKDTTRPGLKVWFDAPGTNKTLHLAPPAFTIEVEDPHFTSAWYVISGTSYPISGVTGIVDSTEWGNQADGMVSISFHAIDSVGLETVLGVVLQKDTQGPLLTAIAPSFGGVFGASAPWFKLGITEPNLAQIWYSLDGGVMNFTCSTQGYLYQGAWVLLPNGSANIDFWANDTLGSTSHLAIPVLKDIMSPEIVIYDPIPSTSGGYAPFNYSLAIFDAYYERAWYTLDGGIANYSIVLFNGTVNSLAWASVTAGPVTFQVFAEDYLGNIGTASVTFLRDLAPPNIEVVLPMPGTVYGNSSPSFNFHVWDQALSNVWYHVGEAGEHFDLPLGPVVSGTVDADAWGALSSGNFYLFFHANDTAGNSDCKAVLVVKDCTIPAVGASVTSALYGITPPVVHCSIVDAHENIAYYTIDTSSMQYPVDVDAMSFGIGAGAWLSLGDGTHTVTLHVRDSMNNYANVSASFEKDVTVPTITVNIIGTGVYGQESPVLNISIADLNMGGSYVYIELETLEGLLYPLAMTTGAGVGNTSTQLPPNAWRHLWDGSFTITVFYTDLANNTGSAQCMAGVDKTAPTLTVTQPAAGAIVGQDGIQFGLWVSDPHLSSVWYTLDYGATNFTLSGEQGNVDPAAWASVWAYGRTIAILFYANDTLGNEECVTVIVICEERLPLWQRLGVAGWAVIIGAAACIVISIAVHARRQAKKREGMRR